MQSDYRRCRTCEKLHPIDFFHTYKDGRYKNTYISWQCRDCWTAYRRNKHKTNEKHRRNVRNSELKKDFGITIDDYDQLAAEQNHVCAVCNKHCASGISLAVDHCHKTGAIRGLLCKRCNQALGAFNDSPELLRRAADYLEGK